MSVTVNLGACQKFPDRTAVHFRAAAIFATGNKILRKSDQSFEKLSEQKWFINFQFSRTAWFMVLATNFVHKCYVAALEEKLKHKTV